MNIAALSVLQAVQWIGRKGESRSCFCPADIQFDLDRTLAVQFNSLRVVDNERYPAYFEWRGRRYTLVVSET